jgi:hypothetical protein
MLYVIYAKGLVTSHIIALLAHLPIDLRARVRARERERERERPLSDLCPPRQNTTWKSSSLFLMPLSNSLTLFNLPIFCMLLVMFLIIFNLSSGIFEHYNFIVMIIVMWDST